MKKIIFSFLVISLSLAACANSTTNATVATTAISVENSSEIVIETEVKKENIQAEVVESVTKLSENQNHFDSKIDFKYTGSDKYLKVITDEMVNLAKEHFLDDNTVEIPVPYIVKIDDSDKNNIKVFGDFFIEGYTVNGTIFEFRNGGSFPGCCNLKEENGNISFVSFEIAEDGSNYYSSLLKICGNDENLTKEVSNVSGKDNDKTRIEYVKMYANANNLKASGIKDYGWPVILFNDISSAEFVYNFYLAYFNEVREEDYLNNMAERLTNLKQKYIEKEALSKIDAGSQDGGADMVIFAQDVTDSMIETLQVDELGSGILNVNYALSDGTTTNIKIKVGTINGNKMITEISST